jgi:hypothetical protein
MSDLAELLHGDLETVANILDSRDMTNSELRAALTNVVSNLRHIQHQIAKLEAKATGASA